MSFHAVLWAIDAHVYIYHSDSDVAVQRIFFIRPAMRKLKNNKNNVEALKIGLFKMTVGDRTIICDRLQ